MKKNNIIFILLFFWLGVQFALGQANNQLVTTILPVNGVVYEGNTFRVDVSVTYNTALYTNYRLKMTLPSTVSWNQQFTTDVSSLQISGISSNGSNVYTIPFTPVVAGEKSTNFYLDNLLNNTVAICANDIQDPIYFVLEADQAGNTVQIDNSGNILTTPKKGDDQGYVHVSLEHGLETLGTTNTGTFPYHLDVLIKWGSLKDLPVLTFSIPSGKLDFITAAKFNDALTPPPFHEQAITLGSPSINGGNKIYTIPLPSTASSYPNHENNKIRLYFSSSYTGLMLANEVLVSTTGATYQLCNLSVIPVPDNNLNVPSDVSLVTQTALYPSIEHKITTPQFCPQNCNFNLNNFPGTFFFEINSMYTQFGSTVPRVRIECPASTLAINSIQVPAGITSVKYKLVGASTEVTLSASGGIATFPNNNVQYIYIENYMAANTGFDAKDFAIGFTSRFSSYASIPTAQRTFKVNYESAPNTNVYLSTPADLSIVCHPGLRIQDEYETDNLDYTTDALYLPTTGTNINKHNIRLTISPIDIHYTGTYQVTNFEYIVHGNMELDRNNHVILFSESPSGGWQTATASGKNTTHYKGIKITRSGNSKIRISIDQVRNNVNCGTAKNLYIVFSSQIKQSVTFHPDGYRSSYNDPNNSIAEEYLSRWNIQRSTIDKVSVQLNLICPGNSSDYDKFEQGQSVLVRYMIHNENQNPVKDLNLTIPGLANGTIQAGSNFAGIYTQILSNNVNINSQFNFSMNGTDLLITSKPSYVLNGYDDLMFDVPVVLNDPLATGTTESNIGYILNSFNSIDGVPRAKAEPFNKRSYTIVENSDCFPPPPCDSCITSFSPMQGQEYLLSGWVKESYNTTDAIPPKRYVNSGIKISFNDGFLSSIPLFTPAGPIIDGWQRIEGSFVVPSNAYNIHVELVNNGQNNAFFDDIRIHPFRSNMKSFVYDPSTQRLVSELDENNYATFYEYDDEGALIRVKKETQRGVMTITESRNNQSKSGN